MRSNLKIVAILLSVFTAKVLAYAEPAAVFFEPVAKGFPLIDAGRPASVIVDQTEDAAVLRVADSFSKDLQRVSGNKSELLFSSESQGKPVVLIGVLGQSKFIQKLVDSGKLNVDGLKDKWEAFQITVVDTPWKNQSQALVIVGSDRRGAIFGAYDVSEKMGVSPWYWYADVPTNKSSSVYISAGSRSDAPKVRYRGIFINDEQPALTGWARKKFGGVNAKMYEPMFELILRLKGNYIWPAMWGNAFFSDDPKNAVLADAMGVVVGTSHHEPMVRAHSEWHHVPENKRGPWDYSKNPKNLREFWRGGIERMMSKGDGQGYESLVTLGMRGDGDEPMTEGTAIELLEGIVKDQRKIIKEVTSTPIEETPQVWALYKEVQDYYDSGMKVPDDVTLLFADDNWGQIRRLPTSDLDRKGGFGVYYHFDYYGAPRSYKWTNTVQLGKVWQQMDLAWQRGARQIWVVNVGDLKPIELPIDFFLSMAWNPDTMDVQAQVDFGRDWAAETFGPELAEAIGDILNRYGQYSSKRKPELTNKKTFSLGSVVEGKLQPGEFYKLVSNWRELVADMKQVKAKIKPEQYAAFFQLLEYPIDSYANLYEMYFAEAWNDKLAGMNDARANYFAEEAEKAFDYDAALTEKYHSINDGKWDGMINQTHMNYVTWSDPKTHTRPRVKRVDGQYQDPGFASVQEQAQERKVLKYIELEASDFSSSKPAKGLSWQAVGNLGQSKAAVMALPQGLPSTKPSDGVKIEYKFSTEEPGPIKVRLQLSPTLDTLNQEGVRIGISIDKLPVQEIKFNLIPTPGRVKRPEQKQWINAVKDNQHNETVTFKNIPEGEHALRLWRIDDNVILEKVFIMPK